MAFAATLVALFVLPVAPRAIAADVPPLDVLIVNARVVDGTGNPSFNGSVGIRDGRIVSVNKARGTNAAGARGANAKRTLDAKGRVVAPGFVDLMGQNTFGYLQDPVVAQSQLRQGITTHVSGEGWSHAPQNEKTQPEPAMLDGKPLRWKTFGEYFRILEQHGIPINVAFNVGAAQVREVVIGDGDRDPTPAELTEMKRLVAEAMRDGAHGLSTSLIYPPGAYAETEELVELSKVVARYGGFYSTHMRNESADLLGALDEALRIGREAQVPVHVYHLKAAGQRNWPLMGAALDKISAARASGMDVTADIYPYIRNGLSLMSFLPPSLFTEGWDKATEKLSDPETRRRMRATLEQTDSDWENWYQHVGADWDKVLVTGAGRNDPSVAGKSVLQAARDANKDPWEMFFDLAQNGAGVAPESMDEAQKQQALRAPYVMIETDNGPMNPARGGSAHPRTFGSFPRVLAKYVREDKVISLEEAVRRMTSLSTDRIGVRDRGRVAVGQAADLVVFDPKTVRDVATFEQPLRYSEGMDYVLVNGDFAIDDGKATEKRIGRVLRHEDAALRRARELLAKHPLIDGHNDLPAAIRESKEAQGDIAAFDLNVRARGDTDIARLRAGGVGGQFWSVWVPSSDEVRKRGWARIQLEQIDLARRVIERYPEALQLAVTADDIEAANKAGRIASLLGVEGGHAIENSLGALRSFHRLGVRYMTLTHSDSHDWADANGKPSRHGGLTPFGKEVVREMNRLGMMVDISHVSPEAMSDVLDVTEAPVIFSHSNAMAITKHDRNVPDEILGRMQKNGGLVMVSFITYFCVTGAKPRATLEDCADHFDHIRKVAGVDHMGLGSDFYGAAGAMAAGLEDTTTFPNLFAELIRRGWTEEELIKLSRGNLLRTMRGVEQAAAHLQKTRAPSVLTIEELDRGEKRPQY